MTRFADQYVNPKVAWAPRAVAEWSPEVLAKAELVRVRTDIQVVLASIINPDRRSDLTDQRQLAQALAHLRKMRALWSTLLVPGTVESDGEHKLPAEAISQAGTFNVRDWTFGRERQAIANREQYVTVARQKENTRDRVANRIATYYNTDIQGLLAIRGK